MRVLSIDGGGIRGLIPALALATLEEATGKRVQEMFDLFVGTSTGGIQVLGLAQGKRPSDMVRLYFDRGPQIFARQWLLGLFSARYAADGIETVLKDELGCSPISSASKHVAVTAGSLASRDAVEICSWKPETRSMPFWEAARATSAAPVYFPDFGPRRLIDGGVWANNPCGRAQRLAKKLYPGDNFKLLSLGTGDVVRDYAAMRGTGVFGWSGNIIDVLMSVGNKQVERDCREDLGERFRRVQVKFYASEWPMDCVTAKYLRRLELSAEDAQQQIRDIVASGWMQEDHYEESPY